MAFTLCTDHWYCILNQAKVHHTHAPIHAHRHARMHAHVCAHTHTPHMLIRQLSLVACTYILLISLMDERKALYES